MKAGKLHILSLDPGGTTGWALYSAEIVDPGEEIPQGFYNEKWTQGELGPGEHHGELWNFLGHLHTDNYIIVCESFEYRQDQRDNVVLVSKEYIGIVKLYRDLAKNTHAPEVQPVVRFQTAATGKGFWYPRIGGTSKRDASKLKKVGLYTPGSIHINDATSHLLHYLTFGDMRRMEWLKKLNTEEESV